MRITVVRPAELGENEFARWRSFQRAMPLLANPFLSPEFTVTVGRLRPQARVAVLSDGTEIVGFFPFERRPLGTGMPIAAGLNDCQGLVHVPGLEWDPQELLRACRLAVWEFDHLVDGQKPFEPYQAHRHASPIMDLTDGFDAFLAHLRRKSSRFRGDPPRQRRMMVRDVGELQFVFDSRDPQELRKLLAWKSAQYLRTGATDVFSRPWVVQLVAELLDTRSHGFAGILSMMYAGNQPIAGDFQLRFDHVLASWFPAYDTRFSKYSPGIIQHLLTAEAAAGAGIHHIDMGKGAMDYKELFHNRELFVGEGRVARGASASALHWARRAPVRRLRDVVVKHPSLYRVAVRIRKSYGRIDSTLRRYSGDSSRAPAGHTVL